MGTRHPPARCAVELRTGPEALAALETAWEAHARRGTVPPFQSPGWLRAWLRTLADGGEPWTLRLTDGSGAVLPLVAHRRRGLRILRLLGHGVSDYLGVLPLTAPAESYARIGQRLGREARRFDWVDLQGLAGDPHRLRALAERLGRPHARRLYEICPRIRIEDSWEEYLRKRSKRFRANLKRARTRARGAGEPAVRCQVATPDLFSEMVDVERDSWKWTHGDAYLRSERTRGFLRNALIDEAVPHELWTLRVREELAAFAVVLVAGRTRYYYLPSFRARYTDAGTYLLECVVKDSFDRGLQSFDFLQGDERYKTVWATDEQSVQQMVVRGGRPLGVAALPLHRSRWRLARSDRLHSLRASLRRWIASPS